MHKRMCVWAGLSVIGVVVALGCSDSSKRHAARDLLEKTAKARELCQNALAKMANTVYVDKVSNITNPTTPQEIRAVARPGTGEEISPDDETKIEVLPPGEVNPDAMKMLQQAQSLLSGAINDPANADADDAIKAQAKWMLGQIQVVQADYVGYQADRFRLQTLQALQDAQAQTTKLQSQVAIMDYLKRLSKASASELDKLAAAAKKEIAAAKSQIGETQHQLDGLQGQIAQLAAANKELLGQIVQFRTQSETSQGQDRVTALEQATTKEAQAVRNAGQSLELETAADRLKTQLSMETAALNIAQMKLAASDAMDKAGKQSVAASASAQEEAAKVFAENQKNFETIVNQMAGRLQETQKAHQQAMEYLQQAAKSFPSGTTGDLDVQSSRAAASLNVARRTAELLDMELRMRQFFKAASAVWSGAGVEPPGVISQVPSQLSNIGDLRSAAQTAYSEAAAAFERVASRAPAIWRWVFQAQAGSAWMGAYQMSSDPSARSQALTKARDMLQTATKGREDSPHLAPAVEMLLRLPTQPAPAGDLPVSAKTTPTAPAAAAPQAESAPATSADINK